MRFRLFDRFHRACECGSEVRSVLEEDLSKDSMLLAPTDSSSDNTSSPYSETSGSSSDSMSNMTGPMAPNEDIEGGGDRWYEEEDDEDLLSPDQKTLPPQVVVLANSKSSSSSLTAASRRSRYTKVNYQVSVLRPSLSHVDTLTSVVVGLDDKLVQPGAVAESAVAAILEAIEEQPSGRDSDDDDEEEDDDDDDGDDEYGIEQADSNTSDHESCSSIDRKNVVESKQGSRVQQEDTSEDFESPSMDEAIYSTADGTIGHTQQDASPVSVNVAIEDDLLAAFIEKDPSMDAPAPPTDNAAVDILDAQASNADILYDETVPSDEWSVAKEQHPTNFDVEKEDAPSAADLVLIEPAGMPLSIDSFPSLDGMGQMQPTLDPPKLNENEAINRMETGAPAGQETCKLEEGSGSVDSDNSADLSINEIMMEDVESSSKKDATDRAAEKVHETELHDAKLPLEHTNLLVDHCIEDAPSCEEPPRICAVEPASLGADVSSEPRRIAATAMAKPATTCEAATSSRTVSPAPANPTTTEAAMSSGQFPFTLLSFDALENATMSSVASTEDDVVEDGRSYDDEMATPSAQVANEKPMPIEGKELDSWSATDMVSAANYDTGDQDDQVLFMGDTNAEAGTIADKPPTGQFPASAESDPLGSDTDMVDDKVMDRLGDDDETLTEKAHLDSHDKIKLIEPTESTDISASVKDVQGQMKSVESEASKDTLHTASDERPTAVAATEHKPPIELSIDDESPADGTGTIEPVDHQKLVGSTSEDSYAVEFDSAAISRQATSQLTGTFASESDRPQQAATSKSVSFIIPSTEHREDEALKQNAVADLMIEAERCKSRKEATSELAGVNAIQNSSETIRATITAMNLGENLTDEDSVGVVTDVPQSHTNDSCEQVDEEITAVLTRCSQEAIEADYDPVLGRRGSDSPLSFISELSMSGSSSSIPPPEPAVTMYHVFGVKPVAVAASDRTGTRLPRPTPPRKPKAPLRQMAPPPPPPRPPSPEPAFAVLHSMFGWLAPSDDV